MHYICAVCLAQAAAFFFFFNCKQKSTPAVNLQLGSSAGRAGREKHSSLGDVRPQIERAGERISGEKRGDGGRSSRQELQVLTC